MIDIIKFLVPTGIIVIVAIIFMLFPPKKINSLYGYRTPHSMKNQQTWEEANKYSAKLLLLTGLISTLLGVIAYFFYKNSI